MSVRSLARTGLLALTAAVVPLATASAADPFDAAQKKAIEAVVKTYLEENPEVVVDAIEAARVKEEMAAQQRARQAIKDNRKALTTGHPVAGNPDGDITLVEFFDYQCSYCKRAFGSMMEEVEADGDTRLVLIDFPILGPESMVAARAALAARKQDKYMAMHAALMNHKGRLSEDVVLSLAKENGLDVDQLKKDMTAKDVGAQIGTNIELARALGVRGTPAFVLGDTLMPGALPPGALKQLLAAHKK